QVGASGDIAITGALAVKDDIGCTIRGRLWHSPRMTAAVRIHHIVYGKNRAHPHVIAEFLERTCTASFC
ncbi:MAG: hypothetical protein QOI40_5027, partial [Alphaproteobacteria bacterium]|nr:hypothetical protein [Alphaproteobacteria bacterium]